MDSEDMMAAALAAEECRRVASSLEDDLADHLLKMISSVKDSTVLAKIACAAINQLEAGGEVFLAEMEESFSQLEGENISLRCEFERGKWEPSSGRNSSASL